MMHKKKNYTIADRLERGFEAGKYPSRPHVVDGVPPAPGDSAIPELAGNNHLGYDEHSPAATDAELFEASGYHPHDGVPRTKDQQ